MTDSPRKAALGLNHSVHLVRQRLPDLALYDLWTLSTKFCWAVSSTTSPGDFPQRL